MIPFLATCILCCSASAMVADQSSLQIVAGTGAGANNGDVGPVAKINIGQPFGVEIGPAGALYITEVMNHRVRRLDRATATLTTVAGRGQGGYSGDGGPALDARMNEPYEVRFDRAGNMYVVEMKNHIVRRVDAKTNIISTVAGTGKPGFDGDGGPATNATLDHPHSIALDAAGAIYIADIGNHRIRRVDPATGVIESIAGNSQRTPPKDGARARGNSILGPRALCIRDDTLWIALREGHSIWRMGLTDGVLRHVAGTGEAAFTGDSGPATEATFNSPKGIAVTAGGDVFVVDASNNAVRRIDARSGLITTMIGGNVSKCANAPRPTLEQPHGICVAADGTVFIGDTMHHRVLSVR